MAILLNYQRNNSCNVEFILLFNQDNAIFKAIQIYM